MTDTGTNRQGAANPLTFEYNKRSEAVRGLARLNGILVNHDLQLMFVGRGKRAADERLINKFASESEEAEAIARAVCDYVVDHPDDSMVVDAVKRAYGHNETLLQDMCNGKVGDDVVLALDRLNYWRRLATVDIELLNALGWNPFHPAANSQAQAETTPQKQGNKPQRGRKVDDSFSWYVENPDRHLGILHQLTEGKRGVIFNSVIKAAFLEGWFARPSYGVLKKEFGDIGARSCYYEYMENQYNETELKQLRAILRSRSQDL